MASRRSRRGSGVPGGCDVGRERAQTSGSDRVYAGARVRQGGVDGFRVVRDRCLFFLSPPTTTFKLSLRIPPRADAKACIDHLRKLMTERPPYGAKITFSAEKQSVGWDAPPLASWLGDACAAASQTFFGKPCVYMGEGGTIPFMGMLGAKFPEAQFMITGVLGPQSNAHGPNEFLHVPYGKKLTAAVAQVIAACP